MSALIEPAPGAATSTANIAASPVSPLPLVRHFRQMLLWPLRVMPGQAERTHISNYGELLEGLREGCPWREVVDEFSDPKNFQERHYKEFITLMLFSEWLVVAISQLDVGDLDSVRAFKREIRRIMATLLRFTERYWFHEVSDQAQIRDLFRLLTSHLNTDQIYQDVSTSVKEMNHFLDSDSQRRQANTVMRLTVVTTLGLVATVATGFLGMNLFDYTHEPSLVKLLIFLRIVIPSSLLVNYAVANSKVLSDFMEALADKKPYARENRVADP